MPQSIIKPVVEFPVAAEVMKRFDRAHEYGLDVEWMTWFISGIQQGLEPIQAAEEACFEWDV